MIGVQFAEFEREVVFLTLERYPKISELLSWQFNQAQVNKRVFSKHGFYTEFIVLPSAIRLAERGELILEGPFLRINDIKEKARFSLRVRNGFLYFLEGRLSLEEWPRLIEYYGL